MCTKFLSQIFLTLISISLFTMEEPSITSRKLTPELKAKTILFLASGLDAETLVEAISKIKEIVKADTEMQQILVGDKELNILFTKNLIKALTNKFGFKMPDDVAALCIAPELNTPASRKILDQYIENPGKFVKSITYNLSTFIQSNCALKLLEFAEQNLPEDQKLNLLLYKDHRRRPLLLSIIRLIPNQAQESHFKLIEFILNMASKYLNPQEKELFINDAPIIDGKKISALHIVEIANLGKWNEIKTLLKEHGAK